MVEYIVNVKEDSPPPTLAFPLWVPSRGYTRLQLASALPRMRGGIGAGSVVESGAGPPRPSLPLSPLPSGCRRTN